MIEVIRHPIDKAESKYNPDTSGISKEDEERYQKLLCENEDLQRLIGQVSETDRRSDAFDQRTIYARRFSFAVCARTLE